MPSKSLFAAFFVLCTTVLYAQVFVEETYQNVKFKADNENAIFSYFKVPSTAETSTISGSNFWISGMASISDTIVAADPNDFQSGPVANSYPSEYFPKYNRIWKLTTEQIIDHRNKFNQGGYQMPEDIRDWPAIQESSNGELLNAPFKDVDSNGLYEPAKGDYPLIKGDFAVLILRNDDAAPKTGTITSSSRLQVVAMIYGFKNTSPQAIRNTVFVSYQISNQSTMDYRDVRFGLFTNTDVGYPLDDRIGTFSNQNAVYAYNGDNNDETVGTTFGYGAVPPVQSIVFLDNTITGSCFITDSTNANGTPSKASDFHNYLNGKNRSGNQRPDVFFCDGNPGTASGTTEQMLGYTPGERKILAYTSINDLPAGKSASIEVAYIWAKAQNGNQLSSITSAIASITAVRQFYETNKGYKVGIAELESSIHIGPNPTQNELRIISAVEMVQVTLKDALGRELKISHSEIVDVSSLQAGLYFIEIHLTNGAKMSKSFVKQ